MRQVLFSEASSTFQFVYKPVKNSISEFPGSPTNEKKDTSQYECVLGEVTHLKFIGGQDESQSALGSIYSRKMDLQLIKKIAAVTTLQVRGRGKFKKEHMTPSDMLHSLNVAISMCCLPANDYVLFACKRLCVLAEEEIERMVMAASGAQPAWREELKIRLFSIPLNIESHNLLARRFA
ncbi:hypothetical protein ACFE04_005263 [Oxalis oulophora]